MIKLGQIASVQMGYSFRSRVDLIESGAIAVIQMKDLTHENVVDISDLARTEIYNLADHHLVNPGDLIFRSRGQVLQSAILTVSPGRAVLAAPLLRIRVTGNSVLAEYLNWYINQVPAQYQLARHASGTAQQMIGIQTLLDLEVALPPIELQKKVCQIAAFEEEEQRLRAIIADKRRKLLASTLTTIVMGGETH